MEDVDLERFATVGLQFPRSPVREGYFTSDDSRLYFASFGTGNPLLLLHGGMGNGTNWAAQIETLVSAGYNPIVLDTRGHGRSSAGSKTFSYRLFCEDVSRLMDHLGLKEGILIGWSDGACTALEMARTKPSRVVGVVFFACNVDPTGTREFAMTKAISNCLRRHRIDFDRMTPTLERFEELQPKLELMQKNEPNYSQTELGSISVPVAVIQGESDEFIESSHSEYIAASLPNSYFETMEGLGHFAPIQDPDEFNRVIVKYVRMIEANHLTSSST